MKKTELYFDQGTIVLKHLDDQAKELIDHLIKFDSRIDAYRARALSYAEIVMTLFRQKIAFTDFAKDFVPLDLHLEGEIEPRYYQKEAVDAWTKAGGRGVIVLPTGSGKSFVAKMCINLKKRPTLIVVPTIDLMLQWQSQLANYFNCHVGSLGGGTKDFQDLTVSTYDSAVIHMENIGNRFGMIIYDECHHLPSTTNRNSALMSIAPFRLGLTATPERTDGGESTFDKLLGPIVYRVEIDQLEGEVLAPYETVRLKATLTEEEQMEYDETRLIYTNFIKSQGINFARDGWSAFIIKAARHPAGKAAMRAFMRQKQISRTCASKMQHIWDILKKHRGERFIIFTADNATAYAIGRQFILPVITHHTKGSERKEFLAKFRAGEYKILVTSKVLNEGVDVPEASVGIVVSGSGSIREHVQRLGRILRPSEDKQATLYELISEGTNEFFTSERRRQHRAYQK